tara:strand:- start:333 stop:641 length:309 start_codon:yes stop_codon:yes gene_type:complete
MIRKLGENGDTIYHISSGNWEALVTSKDEFVAAKKAIQEGIEKYGLDLELGPGVTVLTCSDLPVTELDEMEIEVYSTASLLAELGEFDLASHMKEIFDTKDE